MKQAKDMNGRWLPIFVLAVPAIHGTAHAQNAHARPWSSQVVVPQARSYAMRGSPALQITGVTAGVVIRDVVATTMMVNPRNEFLDASMNKIATATVQQVCDLAFYKRPDSWVDSRLVNDATEARPRRVITFGSSDWRDLAAKLAREGRQGSIALRGDILMLVDGQPVLIEAPVDQP